MRLLGMIGGTSWHSTIEYYKFINQLVCEKAGPHQNPPLLLYSLTVEIMKEGDWDIIVAEYLKICQKLEAAGAEGIIICANTPHNIYNQVQPKLNIPILHIGDAVIKEAKFRNFETLGFLGTKPTLTLPFLKSRIEEKGISCLIPEEKDIAENHRFIAEELTQGKFTEEAKKFFLQQIEKLKDQGADAILLGCTELPMLINQKGVGIPLLDTTYLHSKMASEFILKSF